MKNDIDKVSDIRNSQMIKNKIKKIADSKTIKARNEIYQEIESDINKYINTEIDIDNEPKNNITDDNTLNNNSDNNVLNKNIQETKIIDDNNQQPIINDNNDIKNELNNIYNLLQSIYRIESITNEISSKQNTLIAMEKNTQATLILIIFLIGFIIGMLYLLVSEKYEFFIIDTIFKNYETLIIIIGYYFYNNYKSLSKYFFNY